MTLNIPTAEVQSWVDGSGTNNGLVLKASNESSGTNLAEFDPRAIPTTPHRHLVTKRGSRTGRADGTHTLTIT